MPTNDNRGRGWHPTNRGKDYISRTDANVVRFPHFCQPEAAQDTASAFRSLTRSLILAKASRGELEPGILEALLDNAGVTP
jgi:hypothetical protein